MAMNKYKYEIPGQHIWKGLLLPGEFSAEECQKAINIKFTLEDILLTSYPKAGLTSLLDF